MNHLKPFTHKTGRSYDSAQIIEIVPMVDEILFRDQSRHICGKIDLCDDIKEFINEGLISVSELLMARYDAGNYSFGPLNINETIDRAFGLKEESI